MRLEAAPRRSGIEILRKTRPKAPYTLDMRKCWVWLPLALGLTALIGSNIWFNLEHRSLGRVAKKRESKNLRLVRLKPEDAHGHFDIHSLQDSTGRELESRIWVRESPEAAFWLFPFDRPRETPAVVELDGDEDFEILIDGSSKMFDYEPIVLDYDSKSGRLERRPLSEFSRSKEVYAGEVHAFLWGDGTVGLALLVATIVVYYVLLGMVLLVRKAFGRKRSPLTS